MTLATDAVFVATRHDTHAALAARALRAGKHVFCEKPLAIDAAGLEEAIEAARASEGVLTVGFNRRFAPLLIEAKKALEPRSGPLMMIYRVNAGMLPSDSLDPARRRAAGASSARSAISSTA